MCVACLACPGERAGVHKAAAGSVAAVARQGCHKRTPPLPPCPPLPGLTPPLLAPHVQALALLAELEDLGLGEAGFSYMAGGRMFGPPEERRAADMPAIKQVWVLGGPGAGAGGGGAGAAGALSPPG